MTAIWGPGLDAELAYRAEQVRGARRGAGHGRHGRHGRRGGGDGGSATAAPRTTHRSADGRTPAGPGLARVVHRRRWALTGSGAWPAAR